MKLNRQLASNFNYCLISLFIISYFTMAGLWLWSTTPVPFKSNNAVLSMLKNKIEPILLLTGWQQNWAFFSPNIETNSSYTLLGLTFKNRLLKLVELSRSENEKFVDKLSQEKFRKLFDDNMSKQNAAYLRPDIAKYISQINSEPDNAVIRTNFFLVSNPIPSPDGLQPVKPFDRPHGLVERYFVYGAQNK